MFDRGTERAFAAAIEEALRRFLEAESADGRTLWYLRFTNLYGMRARHRRQQKQQNRSSPQ